MITLDMLKIYKKYNGDDDMFSRINNGKDSSFSNGEWAVISSLIQDLTIIKNRFASKDFVNKFDNTLAQSFEDNESIEFLKAMIK